MAKQPVRPEDVAVASAIATGTAAAARRQAKAERNARSSGLAPGRAMLVVIAVVATLVGVLWMMLRFA